MKLEVRTGEIGIQLFCLKKLGERGLGVAFQLKHRPEIVMRDRICWHQSKHALKLFYSLVVVPRAFIDDTEIEPGIREGGVLLLGFEQLGFPASVWPACKSARP